jgi:hypothetical protein
MNQRDRGDDASRLRVAKWPVRRRWLAPHNMAGPPKSVRNGGIQRPAQPVRCNERLDGGIATYVRKVNEIDARTRGKYDFVLSNNERGENVRG